MTGITDGFYRIRLAAEPSPLIGADLPVGPTGAPVVTKPGDDLVNLFAFLYGTMY